MVKMIYKCPVCNGRGFVPAGFYSLPGANRYESKYFNYSPETCRSCNGTGIMSETINSPTTYRNILY